LGLMHAGLPSHTATSMSVYVDDRALDDRALDASGYGYAAELTAFLMKQLASNAVDVVVLNHAPPLLYHRALRDGHRVVSRDLRATTTREGYALSRYYDYLPQMAKMEAARSAARPDSP
jgi:hypothetical protein